MAREEEEEVERREAEEKENERHWVKNNVESVQILVLIMCMMVVPAL